MGVARTERDLFSEARESEEDDDEEPDLDEDFRRAQAVAQRVRDLAPGGADDEDDEEFADDEFADDDFESDQQLEGGASGFGSSAFSASELDGWVLDETDTLDTGNGQASAASEYELEELFDEEDSNGS